MRFRGFVASLLAVPAVALAASCVPVGIADVAAGFGGTSGGSGDGQGTTGSGQVSTAGAGGGVSTSSGAMPPTLNGSYEYLCGGSQEMCSPDPGSSDCAQGGNPGIGGSAPVIADAGIPACQLIPAGGGVATQCVTAGAGMADDPCQAASDCGPGLGCVTLAPGASTCRPYCCDSLDLCTPEPGTYCSPQVMAEAPKFEIPVCIVAMTCDLISGQPCPSGLACQIVRDDGTTSCVPPGPGKSGDPCPCATGYTCSWADKTCLKLCQTMGENTCGPNAFCEGGVGQFPSTVGYCQSY